MAAAEIVITVVSSFCVLHLHCDIILFQFMIGLIIIMCSIDSLDTN